MTEQIDYRADNCRDDARDEHHAGKDQEPSVNYESKNHEDQRNNHHHDRCIREGLRLKPRT